MKHFKYSFVFVLLVIIRLQLLQAQSGLYLTFFDDLQYPENEKVGKLTIDQPNDVENFVLKHLAKNQKSNVQGYRIRVYSGSGGEARKEWDRLSVELQQKYNVAIYKVYESPHYKIYMGDFRTRNEANKFSKKIEHKYDPLIIGPRDIIVKYNND